MNFYTFYIITHSRNGGIAYVDSHVVTADTQEEAEAQTIYYYSSHYLRDGKPTVTRAGSYQTCSKVTKVEAQEALVLSEQVW